MSLPSTILSKIQKVITTEDSPEFKKADKLVKQNTKLNNEIKDYFQKNGLHEADVTVGNKTYIFKYDIKTREVINTSLIPEEIKDQYIENRGVWYRRITDISKYFPEPDLELD